MRDEIPLENQSLRNIKNLKKNTQSVIMHSNIRRMGLVIWPI